MNREVSQGVGYLFSAMSAYCLIGIVLPRFAPLVMKFTWKPMSSKMRVVFGFTFGCVGAALLVSNEEIRACLIGAGAIGFAGAFFLK